MDKLSLFSLTNNTSRSRKMVWLKLKDQTWKSNAVARDDQLFIDNFFFICFCSQRKKKLRFSSIDWWSIYIGKFVHWTELLNIAYNWDFRHNLTLAVPNTFLPNFGKFLKNHLADNLILKVKWVGCGKMSPLGKGMLNW